MERELEILGTGNSVRFFTAVRAFDRNQDTMRTIAPDELLNQYAYPAARIRAVRATVPHIIEKSKSGLQLKRYGLTSDLIT
jgi:hypothetical protein